VSSGLLGWLGAVALLFGFLSLILQIFSGFTFIEVDLVGIWLNFLVGIVLLGVALVSNLEALRERMRTGGARRSGKYGTSAILNAVLTIALLSLLAFLTTRYHARGDWTETGTHSLTQQTKDVLAGLKQDVLVTAFYQAVAAPPARDLLERYQYESPRLKVAFVDPLARPGTVKEMGVTESKLGNGLLVVKLGGEQVEVTELTESALTNALVKLTRGKAKKIYFLTGHNERAIDGDEAAKPEGFQFAKEALANENYAVEPLLLASQPDVPEDASAVVIAGPTRPFHESEQPALQRYLERGGGLLVLLDPRAHTDLYAKLAEWGVDVGDDVIVDQRFAAQGQPLTFFALDYPGHPITEGFREPTLFHMARSVSPKTEAAPAIAPIVRSSDQSWAERNVERLFKESLGELDGQDLKGPVPVAVAGELELAKPPPPPAEGAEPPPAPPKARIVVVGDTDFASNAIVQQFSNRDFLVNSVNWLLGDVDAITVRPNEARASRLQLTREIVAQLRYLSLFVLPEAIAVLGVVVWWRRRAPAR
jgi:ABC-type uncharacterized transport system involved in gliding motility auxiliary subunit